MELSPFQSKILQAVEKRIRAKKKKAIRVEVLAGSGNSTMVWLICHSLQAPGYSPHEVVNVVSKLPQLRKYREARFFIKK